MSSSQQINATSAQVQATNEGASIPVAATIPVIPAPVLPLGLSSVPTASVISPFATPVPSARPRVTFPPSMAQFMNDPANLQAIQGFVQVMAMCQQNGGMPFLPGMFPFALPGAGTMPLQAPMAVTSFQTPMPQPSPFQPQLVSTMAPVNLAGALNAAGPSCPPQATNPQITPDGHCVSIESDVGEWDIPRAHKKKKGKNIRPATSRNSAFERLGDREEGQMKSTKQRLGQSVAHVSAFARLGEVREAEPARTRRSRSNRQEPARTRASHQEEEAESQPRLPVANRLTIPNDRVQQMEAKLERLEKKVGEKNDRDKPLAGSPFTTRVHLTPFPRKKRLGEAGNKWLEELPHIVWAFRVTPRRAHGETPFSLTYGCEARLSIEAEFPTFRESNYQPQQNEEDHLAELSLVEERRMTVEVKMSTYQQVVKKYHDNKVGPQYFQVGDEVLRRREVSRPGDGGKLAKNWEGPYRVRAIIRPGTYRLETLEGVPVERTWNSHHLRKFYK
ncbi:unnamed protein product [Cuscuta campestris]|uniref:Integrase zinc-binding domain-containing protein n=1 Tax=Cuscuta campestris TaxID=132261 RepID=A0A484MSH0_9ASTE|nr:unnamed protein product [Cuscuta campestris]